MRKTFGEDAGPSRTVEYWLLAALMAVGIIGAISNEISERKAANAAATETSEPAR